MSNRTHYTSSITITAAELQALERVVRFTGISGDGAHCLNILEQVRKNAIAAVVPDPQTGQVHPFLPEHLPGLIVEDPKNENTRFEILREFDDRSDRWEGQELNNSFRNKFWARKEGEEKETLLCLDVKWDTHLKFFQKPKVEQVIEANDPAKQPPSTDLHRE